VADDEPENRFPRACDLPPIPPDIALELLHWHRALKEGVRPSFDFAVEYRRAPRDRRSAYVTRLDAWVNAIKQSWDALVVRIEGDERP